MAGMEPDLSEFFKLSRPKKKPCVIGFILSQLGEHEGSQLRAACAQDSGIITNAAVQGWLAARREESVSVPAIMSHRKGTCSCVQ